MSFESGAGITGLGSAIPRKKITNKVLAEKTGVSPEWILEKSGINNRYFANKEEVPSKLSHKACEQALKHARVTPDQIGLIIGCAFMGDDIFPPMACKVAQLLGVQKAGAFDLSAGSAGFVIALGLAADRLRSDSGLNHILIASAAVQSRYLDWKRPNTAILFGDGAGAAVVSKVPKDYGLLASEVFCHSESYDAVRLPSREKGSSTIEMDGAKVGKAYLKQQPLVIERALRKAGIGIADVDLFIFHQANLRLIQFLTARMKIPMSKIYTNVAEIGNTSDASINIALAEASERGLLTRGKIVLLSGVGAGITFGVSVLRWY